MKLLGVGAVFLCAVFVIGLGCHDHEHGGTPSGAVCEPGAPTYESFGRAFMESYCTRCHSKTVSGAARNGAPADHDFDTYVGVIVVAGHVDEHAAAGPTVVNDEMPPSDPRPSLEERRKLGAWLACEQAFLADGGVPDGL